MYSSFAGHGCHRIHLVVSTNRIDQVEYLFLVLILPDHFQCRRCWRCCLPLRDGRSGLALHHQDHASGHLVPRRTERTFVVAYTQAVKQ